VLDTQIWTTTDLFPSTLVKKKDFLNQPTTIFTKGTTTYREATSNSRTQS
jgi:hypothetical protein